MGLSALYLPLFISLVCFHTPSSSLEHFNPDIHDVPIGAASLAFVFDITGSMYDDLVQVIEGAAKILATTLARREKPLHNYVLVPFHDPDIGPVTVTTDPDKFQDDLRDLYVQGGGDCPEMSVGAIKVALQEALPNSFIYVFTDARAKDYYLTEEVLTLIQQKQSQVVFVMTGDCGNTSHPGYKAYEQIASTSSGQVFLLKKSQVNQVLNFVRVAVQSHKVNLLSIDHEQGGSEWYNLPIDSHMREFTISVSGVKPKILLQNPHEEKMDREEGYKELLKIKKALIVNVKDPEPGVWKVRIGSESAHTIRITGLSNLDFSFGFSRKPTRELKETQRRPVAGVPTHVLLNATGLEQPGRFTKLELLNLQGSPLVEIPIVYNYGSERPYLYNVTSFLPPEDFFYLKVSGIDENGYDFQRITPTAINPITPSKPIATMPFITKGYYDETAVLKCSVQSLVPFTVQWYRDGEPEPLGAKLFFAESQDATWSIPDASSASESYYTCNATNSAGWAVARTYLDVKDPPPSILKPVNVSALPGNDALMTCLAYSTVPFNMTWFRSNSDESLERHPRALIYSNGSALLRNIEKTDEGEYICRAQNEGGFTEQRLWLLVQRSPIVSTFPEQVNFVTGTTVNVTCTSVAFPPPTYMWERDGEILPITDRVRYDDRGHLSIQDATIADQGEYTCVATNAAGVGVQLARLHYIEAPTLSVPQKTILVNNGDTATLVCTADGIPPPKITWFKDDKELTDLSFIQITSAGELIIRGVQEMDAGQYKCVASNEAGESSDVVNLEVGSAPVITEAPSSLGVEILQNVSLPCSARGNPPPDVTWRRAGGHVVDLSNPRFTKLPTGELFIREVQKEDEGMYTCSVENQFGKTEISAFITVTGIVRPLIAYTNPRLETMVGRTVHLSCVVLLGNPVPKITWIKMGETVKSDEYIQDDGNGNLVITNVQIGHEGEYTCVASNVGGNATYITSLDVQVPPEIKNDGITDFTVIQDQSVRLPCEVSGDPKPDITWMKNGVRIAETDPHYFISEDGSLEIFSADPQDTATYSCTALNVAGVSEKRMTLYVQIPPKITKDKHDYVVIVNSPIQLPCEAMGTPPPSIAWFKDGEDLDEGSGEAVLFLPNGALRINRADPEDAGIYECIATSIAGNDTKIINLIVQEPPEITSRGRELITVKVGEEVTLDCEVTGSPRPQMRWKKDLQEIDFFSTDHNYLLKETGSLMIESAKVTDTAHYLCLAENPAGIASREIHLTVHDPPSLAHEVPRNMTIIHNQQIVLPCPVKGTPKPEISWFKDGVQLTGNEIGIRFLADGGLQLDAAQATDTGHYRCQATNPAGNVSNTIDLSVYMPPRIDGHDSAPKPEQVIEKDTIQISCEASAIPPPQITWYKNGQELHPDNLEDHIRILKDGKVLEIRRAKVEDTARYTCIARNLAGETEKNFDLDVQVPPEIDDNQASDRNLSVIVTRPIVIDCPASGIPPPKITWYRDDIELIPEADPNLRLLSGGRRLEVSSAEISDDGNYRCVATNPAGSAEKNFKLNVWVPPKIEGSSDVSKPEVVTNRTITLHCPALGIPIPDISWFKDDEPISENTSRIHLVENGWKLQIDAAEVTDTARYSCRAKNIAGESEKYFDLNVLVPPSIEKGNVDQKPTVVQNRTIIINCPATGIPTPEIMWLRNGEQLKPHKFHNIQILASGRQLRINDAQVPDTAQYRCLVTNKAGEAHLDFDLEVHVPTKIRRHGLDFNPKVIVNRTQVLDCPVFGVPPPEVVWHRDGEVLDLAANPHIRLVNDGQQLEITSAKVTDTGRFECHASNAAGNDQIAYGLNVWVPPKIDLARSSSDSPQVIVNQTVTINCYVTGIPEPSVKWLRNGRPLILASNFRYRLLSGGQQLEISKADVHDTGRYTCIASNEAGVDDKDFDLEVLVPPYIDTRNIELKPKIIKGRPIVLNCPAMGIPFPEVTWLKEREPLVENGRIRFLGGGRQLEISYTQEEDTARYTCVAKNIAGQAKQDYDLNVLVQPSIDEANLVENPRVVVNRTVLLECPVSGIPPPKVHWLKNMKPFYESPGYRILSDGRQLEIARAQVTDTAHYTCIATNEAGELERSFDLEVLVPPSIPGAGTLEELRVVENRTVYIDCPVEGIPPPSILWLKDGEPLLDFPYRNLRELSNGRQLEVRDVKVSDAGRYSCLATNVAGQKKKDFKLIVQVPPRIDDSRGITDLTVTRHDAISLSCDAHGSPPPEITWLKNEETLDVSDLRHIRLLHDGRILQIVSAEVDDTALYVCKVVNVAGEMYKKYRLSVHVPPSINGSERPTELDVVQNEQIIIECPATGIPAPTMRWIRNGDPLSFITNPNLRVLEGGRRLQLISAQLVDAGGYTCEASNEAGTARKEFILNVQVPPTIEEGPTEVVSTVNTRTTLKCDAVGVPTPEVTWEKDGEKIPNHGLRYRTHHTGSLEFSSIKVEDSGEYKCTASNEAGTVHRGISLKVMVPPTINHEGPLELKVNAGEEVDLPCEAEGVPKPRITWQKGTRVLSNSAEYSLLDSGSLKIRRAQTTHTGIYVCVAHNNAGTDLGQVRLEVRVPATIEESQTEFKVVQNREVILPCRVNGVPPPKITWEKDGVKLSPADFHYRVLRSGWLAIPYTRVEDSGTFMCIAENDAGRASVLMDLIVQVPPSIRVGIRALTVNEGESAELPCDSDGFPPPKIKWIHDGRTMIKNGDRFSILETGSLSINNVKASDHGSYVCTAINKAGRDSREVLLRVQVPPTFTLLPHDQEVTANGRIELECAATGIPVPKITWFVNKTAIPSPPSVNGRSRLIRENAMKRDDGTYICVAENPAGQRKSLAAVRVKVPPRVLIPPGNHAVTLAQRVILDCSVGGDPQPTITWTKNGYPVFLDSRIQQMHNGSLVIYDSNNEDAGEYKCVATNEAGSSEGTAMLTVRSPPDFKVEPHDMSIDVGSTVMMNCIAEGEPRPQYSWRKERQELHTHDRITIMPNNSLRIIAVQEEDSGMYICIARNPLGNVLVQAQLTVVVHGMWSPWASWAECSVTCGQGTQFRTRNCDNPEPMNGGNSCYGEAKDTRSCTPHECPVPGSWGEWAPWEPCSRSCGKGERSRTRKCDNPRPQYGGEPCVGSAVDTAICNVKPCPIDGQWGQWGSWQRCSETCGEGTQERYRRCDSPRVQFGGRDCIGKEIDRRSCNARDCHVHGSWGAWTEWSSCSLSCGGGSRRRTRNCDSPSPSNGGRHCSGNDMQIDYCNKEACPVHGGWSEWSNWGDCTMTCGGGQRRRFRTCTDPEPKHNGRPCMGSALETERCNSERCAVDGSWSAWGQWSECTKTCDGGEQRRYRSCRQPQYGGRDCAGDASQIRKCGVEPCIAGYPHYAIANVIGNVNNRDFGVATLFANISRTGKGTQVNAKLHEIPSEIGQYFQHLISILAPVYWTTATEVGEAVNGFTLTDGKFHREVQVEFATGEILKMTHVAHGVNKEGVLEIDIVVNGMVPKLPPQAKITILPYTEDYIQIGPGNIYAKSSRVYRVNGYSLPYAWNHTITYDPARGRMPYLVQRLRTEDLFIDFDISKEVLQYQLTSSIAKGSPSNKCPGGFFLDQEGPYCKDDNECERLSPCSHYCHNNQGSFHCSCPEGFSLDSDGKSCKDLDECDLKLAKCPNNQTCVNSIGSYRCIEQCEKGYRMLPGGLSCQDMNECEEERDICQHQCFNLIGSYRCGCHRGYRLDGSNRCLDIDECLEGQAQCSHGCDNTQGSFRCKCPAGYRLHNNGNCNDIDECALRAHNCRLDQACRNTAGGYTCVNACPQGLEKSLNGSCVDIDECARGLSRCGYNQNCVNNYGGYRCECPRGYRADVPGQPCVDIDECRHRSRCQHSCQNIPGSFRCTCPTGYRLASNRRSCEDIDECRELRINCGHDKMCFNRRGDYQCLDVMCPQNYLRDRKTGYCVLPCEKSKGHCPPGARYADILEFRTVSLPSGIPAHQDLIRLIAYDQHGVHLPRTTFEIIENDRQVPFNIRIEEGKGVVFTLKPLEEKQSYQIKVRAKSYDHRRKNIQYQTTFMIFISVSAYPY